MRNNEPLKDALHAGLVQLGVELSGAAEQGLIDFLRLIEKWNRVYNLTAVRDPHDMVTRHLLDSLAILPYVKGPRVLDIGTGAGLPGIPLAVARPNLSFVLLDSNAKKTRFVTQAAVELKLGNVEAVHARVEKYRPTQKFATLIARAYATIAQILEDAAPLCAPQGEFLIMKGVFPEDELAQVPASFEIIEVHALTVRGLNEQRHLVRLRHAAPQEPA
ncbi:MAG: 16S rRNA (guanine(527)-N(7))-methyltransferase RsmG [Proteobacteria bacterium]|nr:16S rRNA (guanine(527)-N(7))-methyltransferase RsmG [Pseudomonadota bacterium]